MILTLYIPVGVLAFFSPSPVEMLVVAVVALLLFGSDLPNMARSWGKSFTEFRRGLTGIQNEINDVIYSEPERLEYQQESQNRYIADVEVTDAEVTDAEAVNTGEAYCEAYDAGTPDAEGPDSEMPNSEGPDSEGPDSEMPNLGVSGSEESDTVESSADEADAGISDSETEPDSEERPVSHQDGADTQ